MRLLAAAVLVLFAGVVLPARDDLSQRKALSAAHDAWARGEYPAALDGYIKLLNEPGGEAFLDSIALETGELFRSTELTNDGRAPRFSPDGRFIAYEVGLEVSRRTKIVRNDSSLMVVADLPGVSAVFSPSGASVAYLKIVETPELKAAVAAVDAAPLAGQSRNGLIQTLTYEVLRSGVITTRDLNSQQEQELSAPADMLKTGLAFAADGRRVFFLGGTDQEPATHDIFGTATGERAVKVGDAPGLKGSPIVAAGGAALLYVVGNQNPFRRPLPPGASLAAGGGGGGAAAAAGRGPSFGVIDLTSGTTRTIDGSAPTFSADGQSIAYVGRQGAESQLIAGPVLGEHVTIKKTSERIDAPALSPDGQLVAFQLMPRDDWEIHLVKRDGSDERRLTRDNQHDVLPRFLTSDRLVAAVGEPRHRRSFLYTLSTGERTRLFHNNTVRTIAPEYQWAVTADGTQMLVGAERDGNTVSPERGVYRLDLTQKVDKAQLLARLNANRTAETTLRDGAVKAFAPIASAVKSAVDAVSVSRIYDYEKALYDFDSKHISRPGNKKAAEYLFATYKSFGYEPEYQWFENKAADGGRTANVIATLKGTVHPELVYVVSSHYDSVAGGPGADDDSSGTAALLEAARVLAQQPQPATIVFASFTGEESGLLGSREFVRRAVASKMQIVGALNNDMIGWANDERLDNTIRYSNPGIRDIQHGAAMLFTRLITHDALYFKGTDAAAYYDAYGDIVGGIGSHPVLSSPHYHQSHDALEFINHQLIAETSKTTVGTLMMLASSPSRLKDLRVERATGGGTTVSWTASPERGVTSYIVSYGPSDAGDSNRMTVKTPRASLPALPAGTAVAVKAVNGQRLEAWDWARVTVR